MTAAWSGSLASIFVGESDSGENAMQGFALASICAMAGLADNERDRLGCSPDGITCARPSRGAQALLKSTKRATVKNSVLALMGRLIDVSFGTRVATLDG